MFPPGIGKCIPILKKYPSTSSHWERLNAHLFDRKFFNSLTYLQWERVFFKSICKNSFHLFPQRERNLSGVLEKIFCPTSVPARNLTVALPRFCRKCAVIARSYQVGAIQLSRCIERNPFTNSHREMPIVHPVLKKSLHLFPPGQDVFQPSWRKFLKKLFLLHLFGQRMAKLSGILKNFSH